MSKAPLKDLFGVAAKEAERHMPYVVDVRNGQKISLPNDNLQEGGDWYEETKHKGHIKCQDENCQARVHYRPEIKFKEGKPCITREHFKTNPRQSHDARCSIGKNNLAEKSRMVRGAVINLNADRLDGIVHPAALDKFRKFPYKRGKHTSGAIRFNGEIKAGFEPVSAKKVEDIVDFLRTKNSEYINNSIVVHRGFQVPWRFFMIYYNTSEIERDKNYRIRNFVTTMLGEGQTYLPVLMEVVTDRAYKSQQLADKNWVFSRRVEFEDEGGHKFKVVPRIFINTVHSHVMNAFEKPGRYLVLGIAKVKKGTDGDILLDISVQDPRQITKVNLSEIKNEHLYNQQRKQALGDLAP